MKEVGHHLRVLHVGTLAYCVIARSRFFDLSNMYPFSIIQIKHCSKCVNVASELRQALLRFGGAAPKSHSVIFSVDVREVVTHFYRVGQTLLSRPVRRCGVS